MTGATSASYAWDDAGNLTGATEGGITTTFVSDDDGRLVSATSAGVSTAYTNDAYGRRISKTTGGATTTYTWDAMGRLVQVASAESTSTYAYGATGMREFVSVETSTGVTWTKSVWSGGRLVAELDSDGTRLDYLHAPDGTPVAVKVTGGTAPGLYCYHTDASGSVVAITKAVTGAQTLVATYAYGPFGEQTGSTGTNPIASRNPLRYRGYYADGATGLYYLPARYYDPNTARFLSKDPAPPVAGDPRSLNRYAYCLGDPVNLEDPSGAIADYDGNGKLDSWDSAWSASRHASDRRRRDHFRQRAASRYYSARLPEPEDRLDPGSLAFLDEQARQRELLSRHICADPGYLDIDVNAWIVSFGIQVAPDGLYGYLGPGLGYGCSVTGSPNHATEGWCASSSAGFIGGGKVGSAIGEDVDEALLRYDSGDSSLFWGAGFVVGASGDAVFVNRIIEW